jgi:hypothetical protein
MLEYNYACEKFDKKNFEDSIRWAKESYETYQNDKNYNHQKQVKNIIIFKARTLRLLSNAYFNVNNFELALNCIQIANSISNCSLGIFAKFKIFLKLKREDDIQKTLTELYSIEDSTFDM